MRLPKTFSRRAHKVFFFIHLWTGLILGLWFAVIGITGSALAFMEELTALEARTRLSMPRTQGGVGTIPLSQAIKAVGDAHPELKKGDLSATLLPNAKYPFYIFWKFPKKRGGDTLMYVVNPETGQSYPPLNYSKFWIAFVKDFHMRLIAGATGLIANGVFSFFALFMLFSGLWLWWPSTVAQLKARLMVKRSHSIRRTLYDLHNVMGMYLYALLFLTTLTAVIWTYNDVVKDGVVIAIDKRPPAKEKEPVVAAIGQSLGADELFQKAQAAVPGNTLYYVKLPVKPTQPFWALFYRSSNGLISNGRVVLNPYSGATMAIEHDVEKSAGTKTMILVEDLHRGTFGGLWSKILYFLTGLMPLGLLITGVWMWWRKKWSKISKARRKKTAAQAPTA